MASLKYTLIVRETSNASIVSNNNEFSSSCFTAAGVVFFSFLTNKILKINFLAYFILSSFHWGSLIGATTKRCQLVAGESTGGELNVATSRTHAACPPPSPVIPPLTAAKAEQPQQQTTPVFRERWLVTSLLVDGFDDTRA
jgi:hypothetical protein